MKHIPLTGLLLAAFVTTLTAQSQTITALLNSPPANIELQGESYISYGCVENNSIILQEIPIEENGYLAFSFSNLKNSDDISIGFENTANPNEYYRFEYSGGGAVVRSTNEAPLSISSIEKNNNLFKVVRCGDNISFFEQGDSPVLNITTPNDSKLWAKIQVHTAEDVLLKATFEPNYNDCPKCAEATGTSLFTGDISLTGLTVTGNTNEISIQNNVPLTAGTHFTVAETVYEAGDAANVSTQSWYGGDGMDGPLIASHKITYTGTATISAGSSICFSLPGTGMGDALLATNFRIDGTTSNDFCVMNNGSNPDPRINMANMVATALFVMQGHWTFSNQRGLFHGQYLDAYQHHGDWVTADETATSGTGRSRLPDGLACQEPATNLPAINCGVGSLVHEDEGHKGALKPKDDTNSTIQSNIYPNPFEESFSLELDLSEAAKVRIALVDTRGQEIYFLPPQMLEKGKHTFVIQAKMITNAGLYFLHIQTETGTFVEKVVRQNFSNKSSRK